MKNLIVMATFILFSQVVIGDHTFNRVNEIDILKTSEETPDQATVKLPLLKGRVNPKSFRTTLADQIKEGDPIEIKLAYEGIDGLTEFTEFTGFVSRVTTGIPLVIEAQDATWLLRQTNFEESFREVTLKEMVRKIVDQTNVEQGSNLTITLSDKIPDITFSPFRLNNVNGAQALQKFRDNYGLTAYFRGSELFVGFSFTDIIEPVNYSFTGNIISHSLDFRRETDNNIRIKAISLLPDNKTFEVTVPKGQKGGSLETRFYHNIKSKTALTKLAEADLSKVRFEGLQGTITTFLKPFTTHGMTAVLTDEEYGTRSGEYLIDSVRTTFQVTGGGGMRRIVKLGRKIA